ncbi:MAG: hypothetical protein CMK44_00115 [Porticoccus sp.]|nr:hypothetical protein [Porticoccus sp.]|tara:strand:- start:229 stop:801 length:573 start_codon:yes stop_codon:yes gene_type:complete
MKQLTIQNVFLKIEKMSSKKFEYNLINFYREPFFWYLFDSIIFGLVLGIIANYLHNITLFDLKFILLSTIIRLTISSYQLNRFYKNDVIFNYFFLINSLYVLVISIFNELFFDADIKYLNLLIIVIFSYFLSFLLYKIAFLENFLKFLISYYLRIAIFFSGLFFEPKIFFGEYELVLYLNPLYWFYLIFI